MGKPSHHAAIRLAVGNPRRKSGKTTLAVHLAAGFAAHGLKTLLVDLCQRTGATRYLGHDTRDAKGANVFEVALGIAPAADAVTPCAQADGLYLMPGHARLHMLERHLSHADELEPWTCMAAPLASLALEFDALVIDTGALDELGTQCALYAADYYLAAVRPEIGAAEGLAAALRDVALCQKPEVNPRLQFLGAVLCGIDGRTMIGQHCRTGSRAQLEAAGYKGALYPHLMPFAQSLAGAARRHRTLYQSARGRTADRSSSALLSICEETHARIERCRTSGGI